MKCEEEGELPPRTVLLKSLRYVPQGILFALQKAPPVRQIEVILEDATVAAMIHEGHHARSQGRGQTNHHLVNAILDVAEARARAQGVTLHIVLGWNPANHGALYGLQASRV